jgi:uncharacterized protein YecT (DUF1311 family)
MLTINFTGCGKKDTLDNKLPVTNQQNQSQENEVKTTQNKENSTNDDYNKFFFKDISSINQYTYKGTVWGDNILDERNENIDGEGGLKVKAILTVSQIAKLSKGNIYELDFSIKGDKNNTKEKDESIYLWVTEDTIYKLSPQNEDNDKEVYENGQFNSLKYAKKIENSNKLPSNDKSLIICSNDNINFIENNWETEIKVENNICTYEIYNKGTFSYEKFSWELGKGLTAYSWGQGAMKAGMDLHLDTDNKSNKDTKSLATGWRFIDGNWYYFNEYGDMFTGGYVGDCYINRKGVWTHLDYSTNNNKFNDFLKRLNEIEKSDSVADRKAFTTHEIQLYAGDFAKQYDALLNDLYNYIKKVMPENEFKKLQSEQIKWISEKDAAINNSLEEHKGGSMCAYIGSLTTLGYTHDRIYELLKYIN